MVFLSEFDGELFRRKSLEIPCIFPCYREFGRERFARDWTLRQTFNYLRAFTCRFNMPTPAERLSRACGMSAVPAARPLREPETPLQRGASKRYPTPRMVLR
jgi:hypothetical protein